jgi:hypothetical protein
MHSSKCKKNLGNTLGKTRLHSSNYRELASELLMDHKSKDSHHGGMTVVQLDGTLGELGLLVEEVPV